MSAASAAPAVALDHLVVACRSLDAGRDWCEATFGVAPEAGGRHALMGTHNLLLSIASERFPDAYLELIAIDPNAPAPARRRWFDLDDPALQAAIATEPQLVQWVARSSDLEATFAALRAAGHDSGVVTAAERMTDSGLLRWRITLPDDGSRAEGGAMPLWIEWDGVHPSGSLPPRGVRLECVAVRTSPAAGAAPLPGVTTQAGSRSLSALLSGPRGEVRLAVPIAPNDPRRARA